ncbi:MAG: 4-hydroxyphenylpyruvate dioxygenase [Hyphomonadaceae bacterium]
MAELNDPLQVEGFAFLELTAPPGEEVGALLTTMGFAAGADGALTRYDQGSVTLILNVSGSGRAAAFRAAHGAGVCGMGLWVRDAAAAFALALERGAEAADAPDLAMRAIRGVGDTLIYFVDNADQAALQDLLGPARENGASIGVAEIDHVAFNLRRGEMARWSDFFERVFGFAQVRYFHISGKHTGLKTKALASANGAVRIPLNESQDDHSQIEEFLRVFNGEGVQHVGFGLADIHAGVEALRARGVAFQDTPDAYYDALPARVSGHVEDVARLKANGVLLDGDAEEGLLLQIFTRMTIGPLFFELIQRKGNDGFGEGNVTALFESVEADQIRRGALKERA